VPGNATLYYEIELLRCQQSADGSATVCCDEPNFPCPQPKFFTEDADEEDSTAPLTA